MMRVPSVKPRNDDLDPVPIEPGIYKVRVVDKLLRQSKVTRRTYGMIQFEIITPGPFEGRPIFFSAIFQELYNSFEIGQQYTVMTKLTAYEGRLYPQIVKAIPPDQP